MQPLLQWKSNEYYITACVFVALGIQHAMRKRHVVICGLPRSTVFFHIISYMARFSKNVLNVKCLLWFCVQFCLKHFPIQEELSAIWSKMCNGLHVKYPLFLPDFNETWIFSTEFRKTLEYQISWKSLQWVPSFCMGTDGRTDTTKLIVTSRNFAKVSKNRQRL